MMSTRRNQAKRSPVFGRAPWILSGALALAIVSMAGGATTRGTAKSPGATPPGGPRVATIGDLDVRKAELDARAAVTTREYAMRAGRAPEGDFARVLRRAALETLIRERLLMLEAERRGIPVSDAEVEAEFRKDPYFQDKGVFVPSRLAAVKTNSPKAYAEAVRTIKRRLGGIKLNAQLRNELRPEDARVHADVERNVRRAHVDVFGLKRADFSGAYPEPRESDVIAYYRSRLSQYRRPATTKLSIIEVLSPSNMTGDPAIRARADSAVAALRTGGDLEALGAAHGASSEGHSLTANFTPAFWRGSAADARAVMALDPGAVLSRPIPSTRGWAAVRVDAQLPERTASLAETAPEIRRILRDQIRAQHEQRILADLYEERRDGYGVDAVRVRYAVLDTARMRLPEPTAADLDLYYRAHLADYTSYDAATASVRSRPLAEVRDDVRARWGRDRAIRSAREWADELSGTWQRGKRDRALESRATWMREVGPVPVGAAVDTGAVGAMLTKTLADRSTLGGGVLNAPFGYVVYNVHERVGKYTPTFAQATDLLRAEHEMRVRNEEEAGARALFDRDPIRFATGKVLHYSRIEFETPNPMSVPLTRREVQNYLEGHIGRFSAAEQIRARHILISPTSTSDADVGVARAKAEELLRRVRAGEDFADLARKESDDPPSRAKGGDLGYFPRGTMLEVFESAAFKLKPGEVSDLVRTEVGFHIIKCEDHQPMYVEPLAFIYSAVGTEAARDKGDRMMRARAESLYHAVRTPAAARAGAAKLGVRVKNFTHVIGSLHRYPEEMRAPMTKLASLPGNTLYPGVETFKGIGSVVMWVDSISEARAPVWGDVRDQAIEAYRAEAGKRSFEAKRAELDSMLTAGWSLDSLAALWGGFQTQRIAAGEGLKGGWRSAAVMDSLIFDSANPPLSPGETTGWLDLPAGIARVRLVEWEMPNPTAFAGRIEATRSAEFQKNQFAFYDDLKKRYQVQVVDPELAGVALPKAGVEPREP